MTGASSGRPRAANSADALADPAYRAALTRAEFNRLPYLAPLRGVVRAVLGPAAFSYPAKVLRAVYPERPQARPRGRYIHYDYGVSGVQDMLTSWLPLTDIPVRIGGLAVRPGGHLGPPHPPRLLGAAEPGWATTSYQPGDAIIFHCLTPHGALPNRSSSLRISGDFRWQRPDQPAPAELILGPKGRPRSCSPVRPRAVVGTRSGPAGAGAPADWRAARLGPPVWWPCIQAGRSGAGRGGALTRLSGRLARRAPGSPDPHERGTDRDGDHQGSRRGWTACRGRDGTG